MSLFYARLAIGVLGGLLLLVMGVNMLLTRKQVALPEERDVRSPLVTGILLTLANPYFLMWWATVGAALTLQSAEFGFFGFILFACIHWMCDFSWYYLLSFLAYKGGRFFGNRFQKTVTAVCAAVLIYFGIIFVAG